jgi:simple sugar transport system ATP-binding protein
VTDTARHARAAAPILRLAGIRKSYGAVEALKGIDLAVDAGEVVAVCGDNGAGKSTLIRIAAGALEPSAGVVEFEGKPVALASPLGALRAGIATIYQDLALAARLPIWQNVFIGSELKNRFGLLDKRRMRAETARYLARLKIELPDADRAVERLSGGQRQAVAIARALHWDARLVIMDEPTASLGVAERARVLELIRNLRDAGTSVVLISHSMADIVAVASRVAVLKTGAKIYDAALGALTADALTHMIMSGAPPSVPAA